jgi:hypothetical protein
MACKACTAAAHMKKPKKKPKKPARAKARKRKAARKAKAPWAAEYARGRRIAVRGW